jgi:hypothetical protein
VLRHVARNIVTGFDSQLLASAAESRQAQNAKLLRTNWSEVPRTPKPVLDTSPGVDGRGLFEIFGGAGELAYANPK